MKQLGYHIKNKTLYFVSTQPGGFGKQEKEVKDVDLDSFQVIKADADPDSFKILTFASEKEFAKDKNHKFNCFGERVNKNLID